MPAFDRIRRMMGMRSNDATKADAVAEVVPDAPRPVEAENPAPTRGFAATGGWGARGPSAAEIAEDDILFEYEMQMRAEFSAWDGHSVHSLDRDALSVMSELEAIDALRRTVPDERHRTVSGAKDPQDHLGHENSEWNVVSGIRIVAIDAQDVALVRHEHENLYLGAEWGSYESMPRAQAFEIQDRYRAEREAEKAMERPSSVRLSDMPVVSKGPSSDSGADVAHAMHTASRAGGR